MKNRRAIKRLRAAVVLSIAAFACLVQTAEAVFAPASEASAFNSTIAETAAFGTAIETRLAAIGRQVLEPESCLHPLSGPANPRVKTLPAVPAAVFMTLFGFLCFTLSRDRRTWLMLVGSLVCLGQCGLQTIPQLARRVRVRSGEESVERHLCFACATEVQPSGCGAQAAYAGLLRRLAGIHDNGSAASCAKPGKAIACDHAGGDRNFCAALFIDFLQVATNECPAGATGRFVIFSPGFAFTSLSRGPPLYS